MSCNLFTLAMALAPIMAPQAIAQTDSSANVLGYELPGMRDALLRRGLTYRSVTDRGTTRALTMDVYRPAGAPAENPAAHVDSLVPRYSPAHLVAVAPADLPPIFLAMAGEDQIPRLNESIERFMRAAVANRVELDFALHRTGAHGFDQRNHDARTREILEGAITFVQRHLQ